MRVDGRSLADRLLDDLTHRIAAFGDVPGCLGTLVVGDDALSRRQAALKHRACERVGMRWRSAQLPGTASTREVVSVLAVLAERADGVFVHLPLPDQVDGEEVVRALPAAKDVDGLGPDSPFPAASAVATADVLHAHDVRLAGSRVVVLGEPSPLVRSLERVLAPQAPELATVPPDGAAARSRRADVLVTAAFRPRLVTGDWVRAGAAVVDAASGDVDVESVALRAGVLCASPGGIGPLTVARLLTATHAAASR